MRLLKEILNKRDEIDLYIQFFDSFTKINILYKENGYNFEDHFNSYEDEHEEFRRGLNYRDVDYTKIFLKILENESIPLKKILELNKDFLRNKDLYKNILEKIAA